MTKHQQSHVSVLKAHSRAVVTTVSAAALVAGLLVAVVVQVTGADQASAAPTAHVPVVVDTFARTDAVGWGSAEIGGAWQPGISPSAAQSAVVHGTGTMTTAPGQGAENLSNVTALDTDQRFSFSLSALPTAGSGVYVALESRVQADGVTKYLTRARVLPTGAVLLSVIRQVATTQTAIGAEVAVGTARAGQTWTIESLVTGTAPVDVSLRAWPAATVTPAWQDVTSDTSVASSTGTSSAKSAAAKSAAALSATALTSAGNLGVFTYASSRSVAPVTVSISALAFDNLQVPALALVASARPLVVSAANTPVTYTLVVTNTGNVPLDTVAITDDQAQGVPVCAAVTLAPGAASTCTIPYRVTQADIDSGGTSLTGVASTTGAISNLATVSVRAVQAPALKLAATATVSPAADQTAARAGDTIAYSYAVTNTGNVTLNSTGVLDPGAGPVTCASSTLAPAATSVCTGTAPHTVTPADVAHGPITSTATARGTSSQGTIAKASAATSVATLVTAGLAVVETAVVTPAADQAALRVGDTISYHYALSNTSAATVSAIAVTGTSGAVTCPSSSLLPNGTETCVAVTPRTVTQADVDLGTISASATIHATTPSGVVLTSASSLVLKAVAAGPALTLGVAATPASMTAAGTSITRHFTATNSGDVMLTGLRITDVPTAPAGAASAVTCPTTTLAPRAVVVCTSTYTSTPADVTNGSITDVATATVNTPSGAALSSSSVTTRIAAQTAVGTRAALSAGALPLGSAIYAIPAGSLYVSTTGSDTNPGTLAAPLRTLARAISLAKTGRTIVLRAGEYNESDTVPAGKSLTIQNYPHEAVYLDGAIHVNSGWTKSGSTYTLGGWNTQFANSMSDTPTTPKSFAFVGPQNPLANHADGVWVDGVMQKLVASAAQVTPGTFFVDYSKHTIVLGVNPAGHDVKASNLVAALIIKGTGSTLRGIGVRDYGDSLDVLGALAVLDASNVTVENVIVTANATYGMRWSQSPNGKLINSTLDANGLIGFSNYESDNLSLTNSVFDANNTHDFNSSPKSGGYKSNDSRTITITNSQFNNNTGPGMWFDQSTYNVVATGNDIISNTNNGVSFEISAKLLFVDNRVLNSGAAGLKLDNSNGISLYSNTVSGSVSWNVWAVQDSRVASNASIPGHDHRQPFPDPTMTWILGSIVADNNVFGYTKATDLFDTQDNVMHRTATQIGVTLDGNLFVRANTSAPTWLMAWVGGAKNPLVFRTDAAFHAASGEQAHGYDSTTGGLDPATGTLSPALLSATAGVAQPLPAAVLAQLPPADQHPHVGAWLSSGQQS